MGKRTRENRLRELRVAAEMKPYDVAARLRVDPSTVYSWETGKTPIPDKRKFQLADLFGVSVVWLMGWEDEKERVA